MIRHYIKIALRNLAQQKVLTGINVVGLSIGIACFSLFLLYTVNEFSYDRFHRHADRIYRIVEWWQGGERPSDGDPSVCTPVAPALKRDFADVEYAVRLKRRSCYAKTGDKVFRTSITYADTAFFHMFSFPLVQGDAATALRYPQQVVLTKEKALQLFGTTNVVGKIINIKTDSAFEPFTISGVAQDIPANSTIHFDIAGSFEHIAQSPMVVKSMSNWYMSLGIQAYVQLKPGSRLAGDANRLALFRTKYLPNEKQEALAESKKNHHSPRVGNFRLQPIRDIHANPAIEGGVDPRNIWILITIAAGVLLIACINFTTLAIGRSAGRAREVGVRKVMGGLRRQLIYQFLAESVILSIFSTIAGLLLAYTLLPFFNQLSDRELSFSLTRFPELIWLLTGLTLLVGLLAGSYPALVLSGFKSIEVLKSRIRVGGSNLFTQLLVTLQFVLSIGLIIATVIIVQQVSYMHSKNIGFNKQNVVMINTEGTDAMNLYPLFKQAVQSHTGIINVTAAEMGLGADQGEMGSLFRTGNNKEVGVIEYPVDHDFLPAMGMQLVAGRNFNAALGTDTNNSIIVNEALVHLLGTTAQEAIGQQLQEANADKTPKTIIGVSRNFNFENLTQQVRPQLFFWPSTFSHSRFFVRIQPGDPAPQLAVLEAAWKKLVPDMTFEYGFVDEQFNNFYKAEQRWSAIVGWAGGISILLACLGLFGLAALAAVNRTKEIGIRKVLGASVTQVAGLLSKQFVRLIVVALLIASPLAWYCMNRWLQSYAYRININWWVFVLAGAFAIGIAVITVSMQAIKAALANPVTSLRNE